MVILLPVFPAKAALPPYYRRVRELQAILESQDVVARFVEHGPIDGIESVADDLYHVKAGLCRLDVRHRRPADNRPSWAGARRFHLGIGDLVCS